MQLYSDKAQLHFGQVLVNLILVMLRHCCLHIGGVENS